MKEKITIGSGHYLQEVLPLGCWPPLRRKRQKTGMRRLLKQYQREVNGLMATTAIGLMFLTGVWLFLIELAELCFYS
ncbi:MAG: hypothetical protein ABFR63_01600 [Thermodesulfobacteriota bacterium]